MIGTTKPESFWGNYNPKLYTVTISGDDASVSSADVGVQGEIKSLEYFSGSYYIGTGMEVVKLDGNLDEDQSWELSGWDINALTGIDTTLYLGDYGKNAIFGTTMPDNIPERTAAGSYTAGMDAQAQGNSLASNTTDGAFTIAKVSSVTAAITSPANNDAVLSSPVTVTGTVDDPSITSVVLGAELSTMVLFSDAADDGADSLAKFSISNFAQSTMSAGTTFSAATPSGTAATVSASVPGWHKDCNTQKKASGECVWHYATDVDGDGNFDSGEDNANSGILQINDVPIGEGTNLSYKTWYNTEGSSDLDVKVLEINIEGDNPDAGWIAVRQLISPWDVDYATDPSNASTVSGVEFAWISEESNNQGFDDSQFQVEEQQGGCLLYTSDAADE